MTSPADLLWDVLIVGGRCAGAASAIRFARSGRSVLMVDKVSPSCNTLSSHLLMPWAVARLEQLGINLRATGAPPIHTFAVDFDGRKIRIPLREAGGRAYCVRRTTLDPLLARAARRAGVTVRYGETVEDIVRTNDRISGVVLRGPEGLRIERARIVIGADGRRSAIARLVGAKEYNVIPSSTGAFYAYVSGIKPVPADDANWLQFSSGPECEVLCAPCDGGQHIVLLVVGADEFPRILARGKDAWFRRALDVPAFHARAAGAYPTSALYPASPTELRGFFRQSFGRGWALAGDAGYHAHPAPANGIGDALRAAELLHSAVEKSWGMDEPAETCMNDYERTRDRENAGPYSYSYRLGSVNPFRDADVVDFISGLAGGKTASVMSRTFSFGQSNPGTIPTPYSLRGDG